jgi:hypothetical protein
MHVSRQTGRRLTLIGSAANDVARVSLSRPKASPQWRRVALPGDHGPSDRAHILCRRRGAAQVTTRPGETVALSGLVPASNRMWRSRAETRRLPGCRGCAGSQSSNEDKPEEPPGGDIDHASRYAPHGGAPRRARVPPIGYEDGFGPHLTPTGNTDITKCIQRCTHAPTIRYERTARQSRPLRSWYRPSITIRTCRPTTSRRLLSRMFARPCRRTGSPSRLHNAQNRPSGQRREIGRDE